MSRTSEKKFIQLINEHSGIINSVCKSYYSNIDERKDARQDVILQLWRSYPTFQYRSKISTWIYKVSINTLLNRKRSHRRIQLEYLDADIEYSNYQTIRCDDDVLLLESILAQLPDQQKALMILYLEGYKYAEIASMLHFSPTNVSTKINRIKRSITQKFKKDANEY